MYLDELDVLEMFDFEDEEQYEEIRRSISRALSSEQLLESKIVEMY